MDAGDELQGGMEMSRCVYCRLKQSWNRSAGDGGRLDVKGQESQEKQNK